MRNSFQDPAECRLCDSDGSQAPAVWCPGDLQVLPLLPVGVGKDAGTEPESLADARPRAAASEASSGVALPATLSPIHTFGTCPSEVSRERWPTRSGVLVLRVWVTEGQLDWTPVFSPNTSSLPHSALSCCCHLALPVGCPRPRCFLRAQSGLCPGSLYDDGPHHLFLPVEPAPWGTQPGHWTWLQPPAKMGPTRDTRRPTLPALRDPLGGAQVSGTSPGPHLRPGLPDSCWPQGSGCPSLTVSRP